MTPVKFYDWMSKDHPGYIVIGEMRKGRDEAEAYAKEHGITNGKMTKDQYLKYAEQRNFAEKALTPKSKGTPGRAKGERLPCR